MVVVKIARTEAVDVANEYIFRRTVGHLTLNAFAHAAGGAVGKRQAEHVFGLATLLKGKANALG